MTTLALPTYLCLKCNHRWNGRLATIPQKCPACARRKWWEPKNPRLTKGTQ